MRFTKRALKRRVNRLERKGKIWIFLILFLYVLFYFGKENETKKPGGLAIKGNSQVVNQLKGINLNEVSIKIKSAISKMSDCSGYIKKNGEKSSSCFIASKLMDNLMPDLRVLQDISNQSDYKYISEKTREKIDYILNGWADYNVILIDIELQGNPAL